MYKKTVSATIIITMILASTLTLAFNIQPAETEFSPLNVPRETAVIQGTINLASQEPPPTEWNKTYGGTKDDYAWALVQTNDGGYALAGYTTSFGAGSGDSWLVKTDASGTIQWNRTYGGTSIDAAYFVVQTSDGGYALAGNTFSFGAGSVDLWVVKTDANGDMQWNRTYGGTGADDAGAFVQTSDGGYALAGYTFPGGNDCWLVKTDASGNALWNKSYGGTMDDMAFALVQTTDGGYALAGYTTSFHTGYDDDFWLVKTDVSGNMLWSRTYGGTGADIAHALVQTNDGGYALAGWTISFGADNDDFWLVKTDVNGNMQWNKTYGGTGDDEAFALVQTVDGGYAAAGSTNSYPARDFWLVKLSASAGTIYIRADGSIDPQTAPIQRNGNTYTLTGNITADADGIVVERDNIVLDGAGYTVTGSGGYPSNGVTLTGISSVTLRNMIIEAFSYGIFLDYSSNYNSISENSIRVNDQYGIVLNSSSNYNSISGNNITDNGAGILPCFSSNYNSISGNNITDNGFGIWLYSSSSYNSISENNITDNDNSIYLYSSSYNSVIGNNITDNDYGIILHFSSSNSIFHNNFVSNNVQVYSSDSANIWDDGYPSGGNFWSDYVDEDLYSGPNQDQTGSDGIWDHAYTIDQNNTDRYPLMIDYGKSVAVYVFVSTPIFGSLETYIKRYLNDLRENGTYALVYKFSGTAVEMKSIMKNAYSKGLKGCLLIGDLPIAWYEMDTDWGHEEFPTDLFYMDLDGSWTDANGNGRFDHHAGNRLPEIWVGRIKASNMAENEISLIQNYFDKNHNFRIGALSLPYSGLTYDDDDWAGWSSEIDYAMSLVYGDRTLVNNRAETNPADYLSRLGQGWSFVQVLVHGWSSGHQFKINGQWDGSVFSSDIRSTNPHAFFYNLFSCSNARYCDANYIAGWYIFSDSFGLAAISSTKTGGMWFFDDFYRQFSQKTLGESFFNWLTNRVAYEDGHPGWWYSSGWYYGMVILGDPTLFRTYGSIESARASDNSLKLEANKALSPKGLSREHGRLTVSQYGELDGPSSIQEAINAANPGDTIEVAAGIYNEHVTVNKSVTIVGQNPDSVFVVTNETGPVILVTADGVQISNLTIKALPIDNLTVSQIPIQTGIAICSSNNLIQNNTVIDCNIGIQLSYSNCNRMINNLIENCTQSGIDARDSTNNTVTGNTINDSLVAAFFFDCKNNTFTGNELINNTYATIQYTIADISVLDVEPSKTVVGQTYSMRVNVTACNQGNYSVTFGMTLYANEATIATVGNITLANGTMTVIAFDWNTTGFANGNYTISSIADTVLSETNTGDNTFTDGNVILSIPGDINGDFKVSLADLVLLANAYGSKPGDAKWHANADINGDDKVSLADLVLMANHYGQHYP